MLSAYKSQNNVLTKSTKSYIQQKHFFSEISEPITHSFLAKLTDYPTHYNVGLLRNPQHRFVDKETEFEEGKSEQNQDYHNNNYKNKKNLTLLPFQAS